MAAAVGASLGEAISGTATSVGPADYALVGGEPLGTLKGPKG